VQPENLDCGAAVKRMMPRKIAIYGPVAKARNYIRILLIETEIAITIG
jgi:hypothetical protein